MARARAIPDLSPDDAYAAAAAKILAVRSQELVDHSAGVLDMGDIERVHAMRVATRRLRAALEVFEPCFSKKERRGALAEVKELADALGERRDRDVAIRSLASFRERLPPPDRPGVASLLNALRLEQERANEALRPYVDPERISGLHARLRRLVASAAGVAPEAEPEAGEALARASAGNGTGAAG